MSDERARKWRERLGDSRAQLSACLDRLSPDDWQRPVYSEGAAWTVATVVGHLIDSERGMSIHVHKIRKGQETLPPDFDLERWNAGVEERMGAATAQELRARLEETRARTLAVMDSLQAAEWSLTGRHPARGVISVEEYYATIYGHELIHLRDIERALDQPASS